MKFKAEIDIMPLKTLLDPQGKAVTSNLKNLDLEAINNVRIGKHITLELEAGDESKANDLVNSACQNLLANQLMEHYEFSIEQVTA